MLNGVLPVYKESGLTSYDVIKIIKKILGQDQNKQKIGHAGTLDPFASGVLPIVFGNATKAIPFIGEGKKEYIATIKFGSFTDTDDRTGNTIAHFEKIPTIQEVKDVIQKFRGKIKQLPPKFSALRIDGKRAYELAREGQNFELKERIVEIYDIEIIEYLEKDGILKLKILCSPGTYIRSIARDLGKLLSCGGYLEELERTKACNIDLKDCIKTEGLSLKIIEENLIPVEKLIEYPVLEWNQDDSYIKDGRILVDNLFSRNIQDGKYKIVKDKRLLAVVERKNGNFNYLRVFL